MRRFLASSVLSLLLLLLTPAAGESCTCAPLGPPCQWVWESPLVFAGTVIELDHPEGTLSAIRVRFRITEAFRGTEAGEIDIQLRGDTAGMCDPPFKLGESWLIYGHNPPQGGPGWTTSTCSRTRLLSQADEDLRYLRMPHTEKPPSHILGRVSRYVYDPLPDRPGHFVGIADVPVSVTRGTARHESKTDAEGRYLIRVDPGEYRVEFGSVPGLTIQGGGHALINHRRACGMVDAAVVYEGRVSGHVIDELGLPVPFLPVSMMSSPRHLQQHTLTDNAGRFEFAVRHPGPYVVALSPVLWPTPPDSVALTLLPLTLPSDGALDTGPLRVPASVTLALVEIRIVDSAGDPASGARVYLRQPGSRSVTVNPSPQADERGRFTVSLIAGQRYQLFINHTRKTSTGPELDEAHVIIEATGRQPIRVRLAPRR